MQIPEYELKFESVTKQHLGFASLPYERQLDIIHAIPSQTLFSLLTRPVTKGLRQLAFEALLQRDDKPTQRSINSYLCYHLARKNFNLLPANSDAIMRAMATRNLDVTTLYLYAAVLSLTSTQQDESTKQYLINIVERRINAPNTNQWVQIKIERFLCETVISKGVDPTRFEHKLAHRELSDLWSVYRYLTEAQRATLLEQTIECFQENDAHFGVSLCSYPTDYTNDTPLFSLLDLNTTQRQLLGRACLTLLEDGEVANPCDGILRSAALLLECDEEFQTAWLTRFKLLISYDLSHAEIVANGLEFVSPLKLIQENQQVWMDIVQFGLNDNIAPEQRINFIRLCNVIDYNSLPESPLKSFLWLRFSECAKDSKAEVQNEANIGFANMDYRLLSNEQKAAWWQHMLFVTTCYQRDSALDAYDSGIASILERSLASLFPLLNEAELEHFWQLIENMARNNMEVAALPILRKINGLHHLPPTDQQRFFTILLNSFHTVQSLNEIRFKEWAKRQLLKILGDIRVNTLDIEAKSQYSSLFDLLLRHPPLLIVGNREIVTQTLDLNFRYYTDLINIFIHNANHLRTVNAHAQSIIYDGFDVYRRLRQRGSFTALPSAGKMYCACVTSIDASKTRIWSSLYLVCYEIIDERTNRTSAQPRPYLESRFHKLSTYDIITNKALLQCLALFESVSFNEQPVSNLDLAFFTSDSLLIGPYAPSLKRRAYDFICREDFSRLGETAQIRASECKNSAFSNFLRWDHFLAPGAGSTADIKVLKQYLPELAPSLAELEVSTLRHLFSRIPSLWLLLERVEDFDIQALRKKLLESFNTGYEDKKDARLGL